MSRPFPELYNSARWRRRTRLQRKAQPLCERCEEAGVVTVAQLSHHLIEHHGDPVAFHLGKLSSLCLACHLIVHGRPPMRTYSREIDATGWPIDGAHPCYKKEGK